jgi:hypothetical protein
VHPRAELVDHLLVELADSPSGGAGLALHEHPEQPAIGDRPAARHRHDPGVAPTLDRVRDAVPHDTRLQLREFVGWVGAGKHAEDAVEDLAGQGFVRGRPGDRSQQVVAGPAFHDRHRDQLLGEDVERVPGQDGPLDRALVHPAGDDGAFEEVAAVLREDDALARGTDLVTGPPDPLQASRDARRRLDLDDEIDGAHVDTELEAAGRDERRESTGL